jgi:hypothetical protein
LGEAMTRGGLGGHMEKSEVSPAFYLNFGMSTLITMTLYTYAMVYPPFIFESYTPTMVRISIEGFALFLLVIVFMNKRYVVTNYTWLFFYSAAFGAVLISGMDLFEKTVSALNKVLFLMLAVGIFFGNKRVLDKCISVWIKLWFVLAALAILTFIAYHSRLLPFSHLDLSESLGAGPSSSFTYVYNPFLGYLIPRSFFGLELARVTGFMYEGGLLGFFCGFNILIASDWIHDKRRARRFLLINLFAGISTFSITLLIFLAGYFISNWLISVGRKRFGLDLFLLVLVGALLGLLLLVPYVIALLLDWTSSAERFETYSLNLELIQNNDWAKWLFGNGVGLGGVDSGWIALLIQRGLIMLILVSYIFVEYTKHNRWLTLYVVFYHFAFNLFWDPILLLAIAMHYAYFSRIGQPSMNSAGNSALTATKGVSR